jgi:NitT/TauT family transport system substrate-binding protein
VFPRTKHWSCARPAVTILVTLSLLGLAACGTSSSDTAKGDEKAGGSSFEELQSVSVGTLKIGALTDLYVAEKQHMFEKYGIDVKLTEFKTGNDAITAQRSGDVDIVLAIPGFAMSADENGFDVRSIMQNEIAHPEPPDSGAFVVPIDSAITDLKGLEGKKIGIGGLHGQGAVADQKALQDAGADLDKVELVEVGYADQVSALKSGHVDAIAAIEPFVTQAVATGVGKVISYPYTEAIPGQPLGAFFARDAWLKDNADAVKAFQKGIEDGIDYLAADETRARKLVAEYTGLDADVVSEMTLPGWNYDINTATWQKVVDMMRDYGELKQNHDAEEFLAMDLLQDYAS